MKNKQLLLIIFSIFILAFLIIISTVFSYKNNSGIDQNPDGKANSAVQEYQKFIEQGATRKTDLKNISVQYKDCFNNLSEEIAPQCLDGLSKIKRLVSQEYEVMAQLKNFHDVMGGELDKESNSFIENNIKLITSKEYQDVLKGTVDTLDDYASFYSFLGEKINTKELDNAKTQEEKIQMASQSIADYNSKRELVIKNLTESSENLDLKKEILNKYIKTNYNQEFIDKLGL